MYAHLKKAVRAAAPALLVLALAVLLAVPACASGGYSTYENSAVRFSLEYPAGSTLQQPFDNAVVITGDGYRLAAEYTFQTAAGDCFIYSAADFAALIGADSRKLADWVGNDSTRLTGSDRLTIGGRDAWQYDYAIDGEGSGSLYIVDGDGAFGCYCVMTMVEEGASDPMLVRELLAHAVGTFTVTGPYEAEGYTLYTHDEISMSFLIRDEALQEEEELSDDAVYIYPVEGVFSQAAIVIREMSYDQEYEPDTVLESLTNYYFKYKDSAGFTSQPAIFGLGRYIYAGIDLEYYDGGEHYNVEECVFLQDGKYWKAELECTDEYLDICRTAMGDVLFSLKVGDGSGGVFPGMTAPEESDAAVTEETSASAPAESSGTGVGPGEAVYAILDEIEARQDYRADWDFEPLACITDMNGDGIYELTAVYECISSYDGRYYVSNETWLIAPDGYRQVSTGVLYSEVGGNSGSAGLATRNGTLYVVLKTHQPDGSGFYDVYNIFSLADGEASLGDENYYLDCRGTYGAEDSGEYAVDMSPVSRAEFQSFLDSFVPVYDIDITADNGNGDIMPFNIIRQFY